MAKTITGFKANISNRDVVFVASNICAAIEKGDLTEVYVVGRDEPFEVKDPTHSFGKWLVESQE